ncbi:MAG: carboxypeptidase M32, partial [Paracoccaceae bacterium]
MTAYSELMAFQRETEALAQIAGRLGWDQETMMPPGAAKARAEEMGAMENLLHARRTDPRMAEWLTRAKAPDAAGNRALDLISRTYLKTAKVPAKLAVELARVTSLAQGIWAEARARDDVAHFLPIFGQVVDLSREKAAALAADSDADPYDALLDDYEPGATAASLRSMFDAMRPRLRALRTDVLGASYRPKSLSGHFPKEAQLALATDIARAFGYDFNRGRIDLAVHPFSSGSGDDVRITTRIDESDPFNCLYSTIHEVGHACYEQAIDAAYHLTPLGQGVSMGVHESQSRIYENQIGRSR